MVLIKITNTYAAQASTLWTLMAPPWKISDIGPKQSFSRGRLQMTDVTRMAGDRRTLKKDQWLAECGPLMSKSQSNAPEEIISNGRSTLCVCDRNRERESSGSLWSRCILCPAEGRKQIHVCSSCFVFPTTGHVMIWREMKLEERELQRIRVCTHSTSLWNGPFANSRGWVFDLPAAKSSF